MVEWDGKREIGKRQISGTRKQKIILFTNNFSFSEYYDCTYSFRRMKKKKNGKWMVHSFIFIHFYLIIHCLLMFGKANGRVQSMTSAAIDPFSNKTNYLKTSNSSQYKLNCQVHINCSFLIVLIRWGLTVHEQ